MDLFGKEEIRALSWKQPFASLMLLGKIETRTWYTKYRGLVLICASKGFYNEAQIMSMSGEVQTQHAFVSLLQKGIKEERGKAIALGRLVECRPMQPTDEDKCFVKYNSGLWCHIYEDVKPIKPFAWKGCQGWKKLDQETINKIEYLK